MAATETIGPFDGTPWSQDQWYRYAAAWSPSGVIDAPAASASAGSLGLSFNGLTPTLSAGRAWVRGGGYELAGGSKTLAAVAANTNASLSRIDRIVLRRDLAAKTIGLVELQGTPASSPVAPSLTQSDTGQWDLPLFSFTVPPSSGTVITGIVDERSWLAPDGGPSRLALAPISANWTAEPDAPGAYGSPGAYLTPSGEVKLTGVIRHANVASQTAGAGVLNAFTAPLPPALWPKNGQARFLNAALTASGPAAIYLLPTADGTTGRPAYALAYSFAQDTTVYQISGWAIPLNGLSYFL